MFDCKSLKHVTTLPKPPILGSWNGENQVALKDRSERSVEEEVSSINKENISANREISSVVNENYADIMGLIADEIHSKLVVIYSDRSLLVWDIQVLTKVRLWRCLMGHLGTIYDIKALENSNNDVTFFASGGVDQIVRIWNLIDEEAVTLGPILRRNIYNKSLTKLIYLSDDWTIFKGQKAGTEPGVKQIRCLKSSCDGQLLAVGDQEGTVHIYSLGSFGKIKEICGHNQEILCLDFSPENNLGLMMLASGSRDRLIHVYNGNKEFQIMHTLDDHNSSISGLMFGISSFLFFGILQLFFFLYNLSNNKYYKRITSF